MEKKYVDDIYTLTGVTATSQVREFYKEVVANNIEKYVAITTQNIKFKFDAINDCAVMLHADELYGINPSYRKIEVEPLDELIEQADAQEETVEQPVAEDVVVEDEVVKPTAVEEDVVEEIDDENREEVKEENVDVENFETEKPIEEGILEIEEPTEEEVAEEVTHEDEQIEETAQENTEENVEEEHTDDEIAVEIDDAAETENLKIYVAQLEEDIKLKDERAAVAETELERISKRNVELEIQNSELQRQVEDALNNFNDTSALSLDKLFEDAKALGYKIFISKE